MGWSESLRVDLSQFESIWVDLGWVEDSLPALEPLPGAFSYFFESESSWISAEISAKEFFSMPEIENVIFFRNRNTAEPTYSYIVYSRFLAIVELDLVPSHLFLYYSIPVIIDFFFSRRYSLFPWSLL